MPIPTGYSRCRTGNRQSGAATLFFSVVILFITTLTVFTASRSALTEQRLAANEIRTRVAFEHAQAGLDYAALRFTDPVVNKNKTVDITKRDESESESRISIQSAFKNDGVIDKYRTTVQEKRDGLPVRIAYCDDPAANADFQCPDTPDGPIANCPAPTGRSLIKPFAVSCGWSDDNSARHMTVQRLTGSPALPPITVTNPLTVSGSIAMTGSFTVVNYFNNLTYWTGGELEFNNAPVKSFIRKPGSAPKDYNTDASGADIHKSHQLADALGEGCAVIRDGQDHFYDDHCKVPTNKDTGHLKYSTGKDGLGLDVIDRDPGLSNLSEDDFFRQFFGLSKTDYKEHVAGQVLTPADAVKVLPGILGEVIWVNGDFELAKDRIGSLDRPVVLIVEGDLTLGANFDFYGILYVAGSVKGSANSNIYGAVLVHDEVRVNGNPTIFYDETVIGNSKNIGRRTVMPGTWRDWTIE